tara:strand:+ start:179 stop:433 length:255 start_codon:yes stop_codon:yes gene_type:complete
MKINYVSDGTSANMLCICGRTFEARDKKTTIRRFQMHVKIAHGVELNPNEKLQFNNKDYITGNNKLSKNAYINTGRSKNNKHII